MAATEEEKKQQEQNLKLRESLNNAYGAIEGQKLAQSFAALTFEDLLDQQIERIAGADTTARPNALHRVDTVLADVLSAIASIKSMPDSAFRRPDASKDANTPK